MKTIAFIDPAVRTPEVDTFNWISLRSPLPMSYHLPGVLNLDSLKVMPDGTKIAGIILGGSSANVEEHRSWQKPLIDYLEEQIHKNVPILGICYGHQLLSFMHGARLKRVEQKQTGFRKVTVKREEPRLKIKATDQMHLCVSHYEFIDRLPEGFEHWMESEEVTFDALFHKQKPIWTFQPHPEATPYFCSQQNMLYGKDSFLNGHMLVDSFIHFAASQI